MDPTVIEVPESAIKLFVVAGWYPGRRVQVASSVPADHPSAEVLAQFGGLLVEPPDEGEECATSTINFKELWRDESIVRGWAGLLRTPLVGVADVDEGYAELYAAADGRFFGRSNVHEAFWLQGMSFSEAVEGLLLGRRRRPLLHPNQSSVTLYGVRFTPDSPEVYLYE